MPVRFKKTIIATAKIFYKISPMLLAIIGLIGLFKIYITPQMLRALFNGHAMHDMLWGTTFGAISVGQPFLSYIIGGELLKDGASFYGVTAFILSFVTLGLVQLPLEFSIFGARFTIARNILSLIFSFILAFCITVTLEILS